MSAGNAFGRAIRGVEVRFTGVSPANGRVETDALVIGLAGGVFRLAVLVDKSVARGVSSDRSPGPIRDDVAIVGDALTETSVTSAGVVMRDVLTH